MTNPINNPGQFAAEAEVRAMLDMAETKAARSQVAQLWRIGHGIDVPRQVEGDFEAAMDGWLANYLFKAAAADPIVPRFVRNFMPGHEWAGGAVPDARMGGDNPDNCYRLCGIRHGHAYRVHGWILDACPAHVSFTLVENWGTSVTVQTVEMSGIAVDGDGRFILTIDDSATDGRPNHLTTSPRTKFLFVRDSMMDWAAEMPLELAIERISGPAAAPVSADERLADALRRVRQDVPLYYWFFRLSAGRGINLLAQPVRTAGMGGLVSQATSLGRLHLADDEAAVIRFNPAGASYASLQMAMWWYRSIDAHRQQSGLSAAQAVANPDGWITAVIAARDPGIDNWVETGGYRDLLPMIRWQGLSPVGSPAHSLAIVPVAEIDRHVTRSTTWIDPGTRAARRTARQADWVRRVTP